MSEKVPFVKTTNAKYGEFAVWCEFPNGDEGYMFCTVNSGIPLDATRVVESINRSLSRPGKRGGTDGRD